MAFAPSRKESKTCFWPQMIVLSTLFSAVMNICSNRTRRRKKQNDEYTMSIRERRERERGRKKRIEERKISFSSLAFFFFAMALSDVLWWRWLFTLRIEKGNGKNIIISSSPRRRLLRDVVVVVAVGARSLAFSSFTDEDVDIICWYHRATERLWWDQTACANRAENRDNSVDDRMAHLFILVLVAGLVIILFDRREKIGFRSCSVLCLCKCTTKEKEEEKKRKTAASRIWTYAWRSHWISSPTP